MPGLLDTQIAMLGTPATDLRLPERDEQRAATPDQQEAFAQRLQDLATQSGSDQPDLLGHLRKNR